MLSLAFSEKSLEVQRKVVCEEFKEHYINKPYGDVWHKMRTLAFTTHPYRWMTIGKELRHIEEASLADVKAFFAKHYCPANAVLVVAGPVKTEEVRALAEKWFGDIPAGVKYERQLPVEPTQTQMRKLDVEADVPLDALYMCWHMPARMESGYQAVDMLTDILGSGASSRLHQSLVKEQKLFSNVECYHFGSADRGLVTIEGKLVKGVSLEDAQAGVQREIDRLLLTGVTEAELQKAKNKTESMIAFEDMSLMNRATSLAHYELLGDADLMNTEFSRYASVTVPELLEQAKLLFRESNLNVMHYRSKTSIHAN
jgi:predicted Zn-dependent peptidase